MLDFAELFKSAIRVRELETNRELQAVQMKAPFESPCPDKFELRDVTVVVEEKKLLPEPVPGLFAEKLVASTVSGKEKVIDQDAGHHRGGNIRGRIGDYILFDGDGFFVVRDKDERGVPVFDKRFLKL